MGDRDGEFRKGVGGPALEGEKLDIFYEAPPGLVKEKEDRPEDVVPDLPGNEHVRDFLAKAPSKGLWMPLGKEVKCMQCWRCKQFGHRTGDRECPLREAGNAKSEAERQARMDPMYQLVQQGKASQGEAKDAKKGQSLKELAKQLVELEKEKKRKKREKKEKKEKKRKREKSGRDKDKDRKERKKDKKEKRERHKKRRRSSDTSD